MSQNNGYSHAQKEKVAERIRVQSGIIKDSLLDVEHRASGDSVNEHRTLESANASIAEDIVKQTFHNS
ncbi:hypothetical protein D8M04_08100 [Oceanobacillus piezotolerans]|uniref:Small, acid-soluble spore protein, alpha/beta type n=1 Tax=Oceanobacillus piezotolerans TaxID=2448030 RepID=A0A498D7L1_9BACI|nr:hypothetical protein [Oceanobacillus piezotolerans]RLL44837.1 hypothetical protein D8M04_08100 [Oceanobacillus piezotolerans]